VIKADIVVAYDARSVAECKVTVKRSLGISIGGTEGTGGAIKAQQR
jgi:hypothetical protein